MLCHCLPIMCLSHCPSPRLAAHAVLDWDCEMELLVFEKMWTSPCRTLDPDNADWFFVPHAMQAVYLAMCGGGCAAAPVHHAVCGVQCAA